MDTFTQSTKKSLEQADDKIEVTRLNTDQKLESIRRLEDRIELVNLSVSKLETLVIKTKGDIYDAMGQQRGFFEDSCVKVDDKTQKIKHQILDVKYWIETYTNSHKDIDRTINSVKTELKGDYERAMFAIKQKLDVRVMNENMQTLTSLLKLKFKQVENVKDGLRDMLVYQKYFYPLKVQSVITENMQNFKLAN